MNKAILVSFVVILGTTVALQAEFQVNTYTSDNQEHPDIAMDTAGNFVVVWESKGQDGSGNGVYGRRFDAAGMALGSEFQINTTIGGYQDDPDIAMDGEGNFVVVWEGPDGDGEGVYARLYSANGQPLTDEFLVNSFTADRQKEPRVAMNESGAFVIVWEWVESLPGNLAHWQVMGRLYDAAGVPQGTDFKISQLLNVYIPDVAMDESGDFVVAWRGTSVNPPMAFYVMCRMYNADGTPKGNAVQITGGNYTYFSSIATNSSGSFVITWSYHPDPSQRNVYAQRFDPDGNPISAPYMVNTYTTGGQAQSSAAMHDSGELVVVWLSEGQDGSSYGIFGQRYNSVSMPVDQEFQLNTYTLDNQWFPDIALSESGRFVVVWQSQGQDGSGGGIFAEFGQLPRQLTYYVDRDAAGANNGSSWADAFNDLQDALTVALPGDEIRVAQGAYTPEGPMPDIRQPGNPNPADGATSISRTADLSWTPGTDAMSHDVYFGTTSPPPFAYNQTATTFDPGTMDYYTTYYWRIDEVSNGGKTTGTVWSFRTAGAGPGSPPSLPPPPDRTATFQLKNYVVIKGGYAGFGEPNADARDIEAYETILSGDLAGNDIDVNDPCDLLTEHSRAENSYHVVTGSDCNESAVLDGFTITAGNANSSYPDPTSRGGGMYNNNGSPTVTNCTFSGNSAYNNGGGMFNMDSSPTLANCTFSGNSAGWSGGGMFNYYSSPTLTNCVFNGNSAVSYSGGGMHNRGSSPTVTNCTFSGNSATPVGGGMANNDNGSPTLINCILWGNITPSGSQIHNDGTSSATVSYSDVQGGWPGQGNIDADPCFVHPVYLAPISYWKFDEAGGTTAYDSVGQNHGNVYGAQWTTGQINEALSFDGLNDYVGVPDDYSLDFGTHDLSFAFWFKTNESSIEQMLTKRSTITGPSNRVWDGYSAALLADGTVMVHFRHSASSDSGVLVTSTASYNDGNWHHLAGVYTRSANLELYVDGVPEGTSGDISYAENEDIDLTRPLAIGCRVVHGRNNDFYFNGTIDDVMIFDIALSDDEIQQHYQSGLSGRGYPPVPDYHLLPDSPCINAGDPDYIAEPNEIDLDGKPRVIGGRIDMGAYEFQNTPPVADAGPDRILECACNTSEGTKVILDGTGSYDADGDPLTYTWTGPFLESPVHGAAPTVTLENGCPGEYVITLVVNDGIDESEPNDVVITVVDTTPPEFTFSVTPTMLWPPDHKMVLITPSWTVSDDCVPTPQVSLVGIVANEGDDTIGDGHTSNDIQIGADGSIYLRSERSGTSSDRIYTITYQAIDEYGNTTVRSATVSIPHDFKVLARIAAQWLWAGPGKIPEDLNGDGVVNLKDIAIFANNWIK